MTIIREREGAHVLGVQGELLVFYAQVPWQDVADGVVVPNALRPDDVGTTRTIDGTSYKVMGYGGTFRIDLSKTVVRNASRPGLGRLWRALWDLMRGARMHQRPQ